MRLSRAGFNFAHVYSLVARGLIVHPSVSSMLSYLSHPGVTSRPLDGLPLSEAGLVWLRAHEKPAIAAFSEAAAAVVAERGEP